VVGEEEGAGGGVVVEDFVEGLFFAGPGEGEDEVEVVEVEAEFGVGVLAAGGEDGEIGGGIGEGIGTGGDEGAADELDGEVVIVGEILGFFDEEGFDFYAVRFIAEHGGEHGDDAETAAPFAEEIAGRGAVGGLFAEGGEGGIDEGEVALDEGGVGVGAGLFGELVDAGIGIAEEIGDFGGECEGGVGRKIEGDKGHLFPL